ncbi:MAG: gliding motility-associated C-terminal domain-containing protein [Prevotellaceae bacterium]|nr:gliding motility-associated C-terminal domain-containing protein [Prevotellaceae bacterium]
MKAFVLSIFMSMAVLAAESLQAQSCGALYSSKYDTLVVGVAGCYMTLTAATVSTAHTVTMGATTWATASTLSGGKIEIRIIESNETLNARTGYVYIAYGASCRDSVALLQPGKTCEQGIDGTEGRLFFVAFSENIFQSSTSTPQTELIMTAAETTAGTITNPRTGWAGTFNVPANTVIRQTIARQHAYNTNGETVSNLGLTVTSEKKISLYASNTEPTSSDATNVLPVEALGDEYYTVSYNAHRAANAPTPEEFLIIATENNTLITIVPAGNTGGVNGNVSSKVAGNPFNIRLQKGQTYLVKSYMGGATDPLLGVYYYKSISGTYIKSSKLIAVFAGHKRVHIGCSSNTGTRDNLFQQLAPLRLWGYHYAVIPSSLARDAYRIVAAYDNTTFRINGTLQSPLNRSAYRDYTVMQNSYAYIESDQPIEVGLLGESQMCHSSTIGDPFLVVVNPVENEITDVTFAALPLSAIQRQYANIIVQQQAKTATTLTAATSGANVSLTFTDIAGSNYAYARVQLSNGSYRLRNPIGFTAYVYGFGNAESYAYSVGARFNHLTPPGVTSDTSYCLFQTPKQLSEYDTAGNFLWYASPDDENSLDTVPVIATDTPGTYTFYVSRVVECSESPRRSVTVQVHPLPAIAFADTSVCNTGSALTLALPAGGSYTGAGCTAGQFYPTDAGVGTHTLTYTYRDAHGCIDSAAARVGVLPLPPDPSISIVDSASLCEGNPATLAANSTGAVAAQWFKDNLMISGATGLQLVVSASGSYAVRVVGSNGCMSANRSAEVPVIIHAMPGAPGIETSDSTTFCTGRRATLYASSWDGVSYQWYRDGLAIPDSTGARLTAFVAGTYTARAVNVNGCLSEMSAPIVLSTYQSPHHPAISTADTTAFCAGGAATLLVDTTGALAWQWMRDGLTITGATAVRFTAMQSGVYSVRMQMRDHCIETSETKELTVYPLPPTPTITGAGQLAFCAGQSVTLTAVAVGGVVWQWYRDGIATPGAVGSQLAATESGRYTVATQDAHGCRSEMSAPLDVQVYPLPVAPAIAVDGNTGLCAGDSVKLIAAGTGYHAFRWLRDGVPVAGATTSDYVVHTAGNYTLLVENEHRCASAPSSTTITVTVYPLPAAPPVFSSDALAFCRGEQALLEALVPGDATAQWYRNGTAVSSATGATYRAEISGSYTLRITDSHGCSSADSDVLQTVVYERPATPRLEASGDSFCAGDSVLLTITAPGALRYTWIYNGVPLLTTAAAGLYVKEGGSYTATVQGEGQCAAAGAGNQLVITVRNTPADPQLTALAPTAFCQGLSVTLVAWSPDASDYAWYKDGRAIPGASDGAYEASVAGEYSAYAINGCPSQNAGGPLLVTVHPLPLKPVITANGPPFYNGWDYWLKIPVLEQGVIHHWYKDGIPAGVAGAQYALPTLGSEQAGVYTVDAETGTGCRVASDPFTVAMEASPLFIPNIFTPNGDGSNDYFHIAGLENYDGNELLILNKRGKTVFTAIDYRNDWNGHDLPDDTYYYRLALREKDGSETRHQGHVNIKRK